MEDAELAAHLGAEREAGEVVAEDLDGFCERRRRIAA
jgi:hypothetical protein